MVFPVILILTPMAPPGTPAAPSPCRSCHHFGLFDDQPFVPFFPAQHFQRDLLHRFLTALASAFKPSGTGGLTFHTDRAGQSKTNTRYPQ
jgi:hypothetical protein